jgi:hypothetical protein
VAADDAMSERITLLDRIAPEGFRLPTPFGTFHYEPDWDDNGYSWHWRRERGFIVHPPVDKVGRLLVIGKDSIDLAFFEKCCATRAVVEQLARFNFVKRICALIELGHYSNIKALPAYLKPRALRDAIKSGQITRCRTMHHPFEGNRRLHVGFYS